MGLFGQLTASNLPLIFILGLVWFLILSYLVIKIQTHYNRLTKNTQGRDLTKILETTLSKLDRNEQDLGKISLDIQDLVKHQKRHFQKLGLVRFNPFADGGGDQSFAIALLDENNDGVVISSLHSREFSKVFAKPVLKGKSENYRLSKEEEAAVKHAQRR